MVDVTSLALQEKDAEIARLRRENEIRKAAVDRWVPCSDHRDKTKRGACLACKVEQLDKALRGMLALTGAMTVPVEMERFATMRIEAAEQAISDV
jgi:hypothetical protein